MDRRRAAPVGSAWPWYGGRLSDGSRPDRCSKGWPTGSAYVRWSPNSFRGVAPWRRRPVGSCQGRARRGASAARAASDRPSNASYSLAKSLRRSHGDWARSAMPDRLSSSTVAPVAGDDATPGARGSGPIVVGRRHIRSWATRTKESEHEGRWDRQGAPNEQRPCQQPHDPIVDRFDWIVQLVLRGPTVGETEPPRRVGGSSAALRKITSRCGEDAVARMNEALLAKRPNSVMRLDKVRADHTARGDQRPPTH